MTDRPHIPRRTPLTTTRAGQPRELQPRRPVAKAPGFVPETPTLLKTLRDAGLGSRRDLAEVIKAGRVKVNVVIAESFSLPLKPTDTVTFDDNMVERTKPQKVYLALNKPMDVISTTEDNHGRRTVIDLLPEEYKRLKLFPVGRLDEDTTGLILLTNDGELAYRLTHPKFEVEKEYLAAVDGALNVTQVDQLQKGIELDDGMSAPAKIKPVLLSPYNYRIVIHEGRKRIVRRLFAAVGHQVRLLKRVRIGKLKLENLKEGSIRRLTTAEVREL
ncbi:pseudouridine synthase [Dehalogenimonas etheniformans]|uniref:Pseudouridine synthase n=1 Tax=Dehalogenimonas etheniformans TaxID=1536648 RepID=A0A2P5P975_9CHLR|nr:pseudouridine synthase [Dehalogenimonas etheniformans]PPD58858.1 rRNA pseudouridine synthase [Dehalogenimonas etheniformans]QNT76374.1 rRNA pseudouridine synthase [Dehalogenimonas etheniformans]